MDFDEEDDDIILVLPVASGATNLLNTQPKLRRNLVWIKPQLQRRQQKVFTQHDIGTKTTRTL